MNVKLSFTLSALIAAVFIIVGALPAHAAEKTTKETFSTNTVWADPDAHGNTIYTQVDIFSSVDTSGALSTNVSLSRTVLDPERNIIYTDDSFSGRVVTTTLVFQIDKKLKRATLTPLVVDACKFCRPKSYRLQVDWVGTGTLAKTTTKFKQINWLPTDHFSVKANEQYEFRQASATGSLNGQPLSATSTKATLYKYTSQTVSVGNVDPYLTIHADYQAPTVDLGDKIIRGGKGANAQASWSRQNPDGSTEVTMLSVFDGLGTIGRIPVFFDGTQVGLFRVGIDKDGNYIALEYGYVFTNANVFDMTKKLKGASLAPLDITICDYTAERDAQGNCIVGETVQIQAAWTGIGKPEKERFRFKQVTNCDDSLCTTTDQHKNFKVTVTGVGEARYATVTGSLNGVDLGASTADISGQNPFLVSVKEFTIQYGGVYPFDVFPIGPP